MPIVHLLNELGNLRAMRIHPLHVERLILRLAVTGDRHHIAQRNRMLARVEVRRDSRGREELGHRERCQRLRQHRQCELAHVLRNVAGNRLTQRLVIQHAASDQRALHNRLVVRHAQQGANLRDAAEIIDAHGHDLHIRNGHARTQIGNVVGTEPAGRVARATRDVFGRDVVELAAGASGVEIAVIGHFIIQDSHTPIMTRASNERTPAGRIRHADIFTSWRIAGNSRNELLNMGLYVNKGRQETPRQTLRS
ncbi:Hypothetical protein BALAC2494_01829 [Bifidobacterium animalis subsp. lactis CNCM I-2494]|uniref:Uncharacterized protein n=1 Tax=Bifidobacterium animalis subsp. lactis CNCM I-2494 TaxID=1042403 RepID=A0A806FI42_BIFAN|nr:Hypothetical protein BALAC2494_01829 [Bifidobacterium animalis subsp. lactis CNCM I-2494]